MALKPPAQPPLQPQINHFTESVKVLEEKIRNLDRKTEVIEDNILSVNKRQNVELQTLMSRLLETQKDLDIVKKRIVEMASDMGNFARHESVDSLRKYVEYWEPIEFVTKNQVEEIVKEILKSQRSNETTPASNESIHIPDSIPISPSNIENVPNN